MMLHRHFEEERNENMTKLADLNKKQPEEFVSEVFPPVEKPEQPAKRGRKKKTETE